MHVKYSIILYFLAKVAVRVDEPKQSCPTVSISLRAVYLQRHNLNHPCRLTDIGDKSWMSQHQNIWACVCVYVCICLMSLAGSPGLCRSEQVTPRWGDRMKKTLKESGGLIWTALLCSDTLARLLSDKSKTHFVPPSLICSTCIWLKHLRLSWLLKSDLILWVFSAVLVRPAAALLHMRMHLIRPLRPCGSQCVWKKRAHTLLTYVSLFGLWLLLP